MRWAIALLSCTLATPLPKLVPPLTNLTVKDVHDTFGDPRSGHAHEAIDLMSPRGTPVHAVAAGTIRKLFLSKPGGNTIYQFDESSRYCFYYAHLDRYAEGLREGGSVFAGEIIGYVGSTGDADPSTPHLHFTIFKLGPEKQWWKGTAVNPYSALVAAYQTRQLPDGMCRADDRLLPSVQRRSTSSEGRTTNVDRLSYWHVPGASRRARARS